VAYYVFSQSDVANFIQGLLHWFNGYNQNVSGEVCWSSILEWESTGYRDNMVLLDYGTCTIVIVMGRIRKGVGYEQKFLI